MLSPDHSLGVRDCQHARYSFLGFLALFLVRCLMPRASVFAVAMLLLLAACAGRIPMGARNGSVGKTNDGCLIGGARLESNDDLLVLNADNCWGTPELVELLQAAAHEMRAAYPEAPPLVVGDLSREGGGRLSPHESHQSGRDADVALYATDNKTHKRFLDMTRGALDVPKTWSLIQTLLEKGHVQYILMDWEVQKLIYEEISLFVPEQELSRIFQYPRPRGARAGVIRHAAGHRDHMHIRIRCPAGDVYCTD